MTTEVAEGGTLFHIQNAQGASATRTCANHLAIPISIEANGNLIGGGRQYPLAADTVINVLCGQTNSHYIERPETGAKGMQGMFS